MGWSNHWVHKITTTEICLNAKQHVRLQTRVIADATSSVRAYTSENSTLRILESTASSSCESGLTHINRKGSPAGHILQLHSCRVQTQPQRLRSLKAAYQAMLTYCDTHGPNNKKIRCVQVQLKFLQRFAERDSRVLSFIITLLH